MYSARVNKKRCRTLQVFFQFQSFYWLWQNQRFSACYFDIAVALLFWFTLYNSVSSCFQGFKKSQHLVVQHFPAKCTVNGGNVAIKWVSERLNWTFFITIFQGDAIISSHAGFVEFVQKQNLYTIFLFCKHECERRSSPVSPVLLYSKSLLLTSRASSPLLQLLWKTARLQYGPKVRRSISSAILVSHSVLPYYTQTKNIDPAAIIFLLRHYQIVSLLLLSLSAGVMACQYVMCCPLHECFLLSYCRPNSQDVSSFLVSFFFCICTVQTQATLCALILRSSGGFLHQQQIPGISLNTTPGLSGWE